VKNSNYTISTFPLGAAMVSTMIPTNQYLPGMPGTPAHVQLLPPEALPLCVAHSGVAPVH